MNKLANFSILLALTLCAETSLADNLNGFDVSNLTVDMAALSPAGPPRGSIPAINKPRYVSAAKANFLDDDDVVLGFVDGNQSYAYPRHILNWHEIINEKNFVLVYCPLCGSGTALANKVDGKHLSFAVSDLVYNSGIVLYDRQTKSLWSPLEKSAIAGPLVNTKLNQLPLETTTWAQWKRKYRRTLVLSESQGFKRNYRHYPFTGYDTSELLFFNVLQQAPEDYHNKEWVLGIEAGDVAKAYPYSELRKLPTNLIADEVNGEAFEIHWDKTNNTAYATRLNGDPAVTTTAFWFAWFNFHPETLIFKAE